MAQRDLENGNNDDNNYNISIAQAVKMSIREKLRNDSPIPASGCIFRVPQVLRRQKQEAYTPDIVSIGPFHRGKQFQVMENVKHWYLQGLLSRRSNLSLDSLINGVLEYNERACNCYPEPVLADLRDNEFVEMLVVDGCFLLELFRKVVSRRYCLQDEKDPIFNEACMLQSLYHDLLLLENQLPWFVLERLYDLTGKSTNTQSSSLVELVLTFFRRAESHLHLFPPVTNLPFQVVHILDLLGMVIVHGFKVPETQENEKMEPKLPQRIPSATALADVGVKFVKHPQPNCIMDIQFKNGVFSIPSLAIDKTTAPLFRNLIAFDHGCLHKITSYAVLMDNLIGSSKDVDLLCEKGILANWLNAEDAAKFFNDIYNDTTVIEYCYLYQGLCNNVKKYYDKKWMAKLRIDWMEKLRSDYFSTPCATISFIAAFTLLLLTLLQTIFTLHPPK